MNPMGDQRRLGIFPMPDPGVADIPDSFHPIRPGIMLVTPRPELPLPDEVFHRNRCMIWAFSYDSEQKTGTGVVEQILGTARELDSFQKDTAFQMVLAARPDSLLALLDTDCKLLPESLVSALTNREAWSFQRPMDPVSRSLVFRIRSKTPRSFERRIFYRRLGLQILENEIHVLTRPVEKRQKNRLLLKRIECKRLEQSRKILTRDLENPPDIKTLSRLAGLNENKLKTGFRQLFGQPPMAYLRRYRMKTAKQLIESKGFSVTRAALCVGYSNPSAFSARFLKHYGYSPSQIKKHS